MLHYQNCNSQQIDKAGKIGNLNVLGNPRQLCNHIAFSGISVH